MSQPKNEDGETTYLDFDRVAYLLDERIKVICSEVEATEEPTIYLTSNKKMCEQAGIEYKPNFREDVAITKQYKGTRKTEKPFHFNNITAYMLAIYDCNVSNGLEADDTMCIDQCSSTKTIICSRDKDLRMCPGWHYSWECGKQSSIGPIFVEENHEGWLEKKPDGKVIGYGDKFFYFQMLTGDTVDNIPGCPGVGKVGAFKLLNEVYNKRELYEIVRDCYIEKFNSRQEAIVYFKEQAYLLWMVREMKDVEPVMYKPPVKE